MSRLQPEGPAGRAWTLAACLGSLLFALPVAAQTAGSPGAASARPAKTAPADVTGRFGFGALATPQQIAGWDIDVRPDGHGVRKGRGSVSEGEVVYEAQCASCHGTFGESNAFMWVAGGVKPQDLKTGRASALLLPDGQRTVGTKLGHVTTLWDYIYRAMPWTNPQSLTVDQTYAVTAYVLHLNQIVPADFVLSEANILTLPLPNRDGMTRNHGLGSVSGKPDVQGSSCMKSCASAVRVTSELPEFARNQHGNLAEQKRPLGPVRGVDTTRYEARRVDPLRASGVVQTAAAAPAPAAAAASPAAAAAASVSAAPELLKKHACVACHQQAARVVGPSWNDIAQKYAARADRVAYLAGKIKAGGQGVWGQIPMPAQPGVPEADVQAMAGWLAAGAK